MPRYFFTIHSADHLIEDDQRGVVLPDDRTALSYAEHAIGARPNEHNDPQLIMFVMDDQHVTLWSLPFVPACA
jgi:hypothetical protein